MIEKTRIHRAMLRLDRAGAFTAKDVQRETAANAATVRQVFGRDREDGLLAEAAVDGRADGRERPVRLTVRGRVRLETEEAAFRAALGGLVAAEPEEPAGALALEVALTTLDTLAEPDDVTGVQERLLLAAAELRGAVRAGLPAAVAIAAAVRRAAESVAALDEADDPMPVCAALTAEVAAWREAPAAGRLDMVLASLPVWRAEAAGLARTPAEAERLLEQALADALAKAAGEGGLIEGVRAALRQRADALKVTSDGPVAVRQQPDANVELKQLIDEVRALGTQIGGLGAQIDTGHAAIFGLQMQQVAYGSALRNWRGPT